MTTRAELEREAAKRGATVKVLPGALLDVEVAAPNGMHWDGRVHVLVRAQEYGEPVSSVWAELLEKMADGLRPCDARCAEAT